MTTVPTYTKTFLCLANSRKPGGHCVAGRTFSKDEYLTWLRPVSTRNTHEISDAEQSYADGTGAQVLDFIKVTFSGVQPHLHQTENHVIAAARWEKHSEATWDDVEIATETVEAPLWHDGTKSFHGLNDKVSEEVLKTLHNSLCLVEPEKLTLVVAQESKYGGGYERRVRADFTLNKTPYNFVVTDPWIERKYYAMDDGRHEVKTSRLCLSLPEIINGNATKLVAAVITPDGVKERR
jgi:hypothetical protein